MVSVIIPVYNVCDYIDACLKSVVEQTWSEFEIILVDDGSTDGSDKKCREWLELDSRIRLICRENMGLGPARNLGVKLARYEYITFLDSDDWWDHHYLEEMIEPFLKMDPDIVCCDIHYWEKDENGTVTDSISKLRIESGKTLLVSENKELINTARTFMWGKIYKKKIFTENKIIAPAHVYEDVAVTPFAVANAVSLYRVSKPLYFYHRKRQGSLANCVSGLRDMKLSLQEAVLSFKDNDLFESYKKQLKKLFYSQVRFIVKKAQALCSEKEFCEIKKDYFDLLVEYFPEMEKLLKGYFCVEGKPELKAALRLLVIDDRQIVDCRTVKGQKDELPERIIFALEVSGAGKIFMKVSSGEEDKCKTVRVELPFCIEKAGEGQLWDLADRLFYEL